MPLERGEVEILDADLLLEAVAHDGAHDLVGLTKRHALAHEVIGEIGGVREIAPHAGCHALDLELGRETLPRDPRAVRAVLNHLKRWFSGLSARLDAGERFPDAVLNFITQLSMLELNLLERRVSKLASSIDPYDARGIARLMPVLSFYDQDIEHMKNVVARLSTYQPFNERLLTMEHALSSSEMEKLLKALTRDPQGGPLLRLTRGMRGAPMLDREYAYLVSALHQAATLRHLELDAPGSPDVLTSSCTWWRAAARPPADADGPELAETLWPVVSTGFQCRARRVRGGGTRGPRGALSTGEACRSCRIARGAHGAPAVGPGPGAAADEQRRAICGLLDNAPRQSPGLVA